MTPFLKSHSNKPKRVSLPRLTKKQLKWNQRAKETITRISKKYQPTAEEIWDDVRDA